MLYRTSSAKSRTHCSIEMYGSVEQGKTRKGRASAIVAAVGATGLAVVAVIALTSALSPSGTSLLQTHEVLGFQTRQQASRSQKANNLIKQWAKNPALRKLMRHALAEPKSAAASVNRFVSKVGKDLKKDSEEHEDLNDIEHDLQKTGMDAEKTELAYEAICHQEVGACCWVFCNRIHRTTELGYIYQLRGHCKKRKRSAFA